MIELRTLVPGDSYFQNITYQDYPSSEWSLTLTLAGNNGTASVTATPSDDASFDVLLSSAQSGVLKPGIYRYSVRVTKGDDRRTIESGNVRVQPDPTNADRTISTAEKMIEYIDKALLNQLEGEEAVDSVSYGGRSVSFMDRRQLLAERAIWLRVLKAYRGGNSNGIRAIPILVPSRFPH